MTGSTYKHNKEVIRSSLCVMINNNNNKSFQFFPGIVAEFGVEAA